MGGRLNRRDEAETVTKAELGTKRVCPNCGTRYYDLNRDPIICPKCGTQFELSAQTRARQAPVKPVAPVEPEVEAEKEDVETVTLEEADEEAADTGAVEVEGGDEIEGDDDDEDDTFLPDDEDEDDEGDVDDIVGDVDEEE
jgi:uncharacterized protein (TIGR02300 family)